MITDSACPLAQAAGPRRSTRPSISAATQTDSSLINLELSRASDGLGAAEPSTRAESETEADLAAVTEPLADGPLPLDRSETPAGGPAHLTDTWPPATEASVLAQFGRGHDTSLLADETDEPLGDSQEGRGGAASEGPDDGTETGAWAAVVADGPSPWDLEDGGDGVPTGLLDELLDPELLGMPDFADGLLDPELLGAPPPMMEADQSFGKPVRDSLGGADESGFGLVGLHDHRVAAGVVGALDGPSVNRDVNADPRLSASGVHAAQVWKDQALSTRDEHSPTDSKEAPFELGGSDGWSDGYASC